MTHEITLSINSGYIRASCSCGEFNGEAWRITLADLNGFVHEHIEAAEAEDAEEMSPFVEMLVSGSYQTIADVPPEGYGTKSAITSEDELVDIETGLRKGAST